MAKYWYLILLPTLFACKEDPEAEIPTYLRVDGFNFSTDFPSQGTAHQNITTVWVTMDGEVVGAFEPPIEVPLIGEGEKEIKIYPGLNLNGSSAYRFLNEFWEPYVETINLKPGSVVYPNQNNDSLPTSTYVDKIGVNPLEFKFVENFNGAGINFEQTSKSDTGFIKTSDPDDLFMPSGLNEVNVNSGKLVLSKDTSLVEVVTIQSYQLTPINSANENIIVEFNYKSDINFTLGLFINRPGSVDQTPVVEIFPSSEWNKFYANLITEVQAVPDAIDFKLFIGAFRQGENLDNQEILIDNIKITHL